MPSPHPDNGLATFRLAVLRSERGRIVAMLVLFSALTCLGVVRLFAPVLDLPQLGVVVITGSVVALVFEALALLHVNAKLRRGDGKPSAFLCSVAVLECCLPVVTMVAVAQIGAIDPLLVPVSPPYALAFVFLILSTLRADPGLAAVVGSITVASYAAFVAYTLATTPAEAQLPLPRPLYVTCVFVLLLGAATSWYVSIRMRRYIASVAQEAELRLERDRVARDLAAAREIQQRLFPESMPVVEGYDIAGMSRPADQTGGDYYDWQPITRDRFVLSIADVTGHGIGPALVTAGCRAYVRATVAAERSVADVIDRVDSLLTSDLPGGRFVTFAMLDIDFANHRALFLSAGHGPSFLVRASSDGVSSINAQGLPLGLSSLVGTPGDGALDDPVEFSFEPGDVLAMFSDGFFEWANAQGEQFGTERLSRVIAENRAKPASEIVAAMDDAIRAFVGDQTQPDDMTAVLIKRQP